MSEQRFEVDVEVLMQQLDQQQVEIGRLRLMNTTLMNQVSVRDEEIASLKKAKPTKRTTAKKE